MCGLYVEMNIEWLVEYHVYINFKENRFYFYKCQIYAKSFLKNQYKFKLIFSLLFKLFFKSVCVSFFMTLVANVDSNFEDSNILKSGVS